MELRRVRVFYPTTYSLNPLITAKEREGAIHSVTSTKRYHCTSGGAWENRIPPDTDPCGSSTGDHTPRYYDDVIKVVTRVMGYRYPRSADGWSDRTAVHTIQIEANFDWIKIFEMVSGMPLVYGPC